MQTAKTKIIKRKNDGEVVIPNDSVNSKGNVIKEVRRARGEFKSLAERVAGDSLVYLNHYFAGGIGFFPNEPDKRKVAKFFPYAEGGPLYVDEPMLERDEKLCEEKSEIMKKLGHRYLIIKRTMNELDCFEALA